jgi:hypothetical protein
MRTRLDLIPEKKPDVLVFHISLEEPTDEDMKSISDIAAGGIPVDKIAKVHVRTEKATPKAKMLPEERNERNRNSRRSVSVSKSTYEKLKESAQANERSMSNIVESECDLFFDSLVKVSTD